MKYGQGFLDFIRTQGVVGLAVGFILGGAVSKLVSSIVTDLVNPIIGLAIGSTAGLAQSSWTIGSATITWGKFVATFIDFLVIALVVYFGVKVLGLDKIDKKKE